MQSAIDSNELQLLFWLLHSSPGNTQKLSGAAHRAMGPSVVLGERRMLSSWGLVGAEHSGVVGEGYVAGLSHI